MLNEKLVSSTKVYTYRFKGKNRDKVAFKEFYDSNLLINYCCNQHSEIFQIALPEYECIYTESYDYTNIIYYKNFDKLNQLLKLVTECGLYTIEHWEQ